MLERTRGIVLHMLRYDDNHIIADIFTESRGSVSFLVRMPRSHRSKVRSVLLRPLNILELDFDYRPQHGLQRIREMRVAMPYVSLPYHPVKCALALFLAEFLHYSLRNEGVNPPLFHYITFGLRWLDEASEGLSNFHLVFLMRMSRFMGFWPNVDEAAGVASGTCVFDLREGVLSRTVPMHSDYLRRDEARLVPLFLHLDYGTMHRLTMSRSQRNRVLEVIIEYYRLHVPEIPEMKSVAVLHDMLT